MTTVAPAYVQVTGMPNFGSTETHHPLFDHVGVEVLDPSTEIAKGVVQLAWGLIQSSPVLMNWVNRALEGNMFERVVIGPRADDIYIKLPQSAAEDIHQLGEIIRDSSEESDGFRKPDVFFSHPDILDVSDYYHLPFFGQMLAESAGEELERLFDIYADLETSRVEGGPRYPITDDQFSRASFTYLSDMKNLPPELAQYKVTHLVQSFETKIRTLSPLHLIKILSAFDDKPELFSHLFNLFQQSRPELLKEFSPHELGELLKVVSLNKSNLDLFVQKAEEQQIELSDIPLEKFHEAFLEVCSTRVTKEGHDSFAALHGAFLLLTQELEIEIFEELPNEILMEAMIQQISSDNPDNFIFFVDRLPGQEAYFSRLSNEQLGRAFVALASTGPVPSPRLNQRFKAILEQNDKVIPIPVFRKAWLQAFLKSNEHLHMFEESYSVGVEQNINSEVYRTMLIENCNQISSQLFFHRLAQREDIVLSQEEISQILLKIEPGTRFNFNSFMTYLKIKGLFEDTLANLSIEVVEHIYQVFSQAGSFWKGIHMRSFMRLLERFEKVSFKAQGEILASSLFNTGFFSCIISKLDSSNNWGSIPQEALNKLLIQSADDKENLIKVLKLAEQRNLTFELSSADVGEALIRSIHNPKAFSVLVEFLGSTGQLSKMTPSAFIDALSKAKFLMAPARLTLLNELITFLEKGYISELELTQELGQVLVDLAGVDFSIFFRLFTHLEQKGKLNSIHPRLFLRIFSNVLKKSTRAEFSQFLTLIEKFSGQLLDQLPPEEIKAWFKTWPQNLVAARIGAIADDSASNLHVRLTEIFGESAIIHLVEPIANALVQSGIEVNRHLAVFEEIFNLSKFYRNSTGQPLLLPLITFKDLCYLQSEFNSSDVPFENIWNEFVLPYFDHPDQLTLPLLNTFFKEASFSVEAVNKVNSYVVENNIPLDRFISPIEILATVLKLRATDATIPLIFKHYGKEGVNYIRHVDLEDLVELIQDMIYFDVDRTEEIIRSIITELGPTGANILRNLPAEKKREIFLKLKYGPLVSDIMGVKELEEKNAELANQFRVASGLPEQDALLPAAEEQLPEPANHESSDEEIDAAPAAQIGPIAPAFEPQFPGRIARMCQALTDAIRWLTGR